jgi:hypothetical protein
MLHDVRGSLAGALVPLWQLHSLRKLSGPVLREAFRAARRAGRWLPAYLVLEENRSTASARVQNGGLTQSI